MTTTNNKGKIGTPMHIAGPNNWWCPMCSSKLRVRYGGYSDKFKGCSNFPNCRYTETTSKPKTS